MYFSDEFYLCQVFLPLGYVYLCYPAYLSFLIRKSQEGFLVSDHLCPHSSFELSDHCWSLHPLYMFCYYFLLPFDFSLTSF
jgi:hypothetical protein